MTHVVRSASLFLVSLVFATSSPAIGETLNSKDTVQIDWVTLPVTADSTQAPVKLDKDSPILFTRVMPKEIFVSSIAVRDGPLRLTSGGNSVPVGTLLARASNQSGQYCEPARRRKQNFIYCVEDSDKDGTLDTISGVPAMVISRNLRTHYEILVGRMPKRLSARLESPVAVSSLSPAAASEQAKFDVMLTQTDKRSVALCIWRYAGNALIDGLGNAPFCGPSWNLATMSFPKTATLYGGQITLSQSASGEIQATIVPPPAGLPFPN